MSDLNDRIQAWVNECMTLCEPDHVQWCNGSYEESLQLLKESVENGQAVELNPKLHPNSFLFRSDPSDVARVEDRTFISTTNQEDAGPTNRWIAPDQLKATMRSLYQGCMHGRTMYVMPFVMGPLGSSFSKLGVQITDSPYVVANMRIMTRMGTPVLNYFQEHDSFVPCLHSIGAPSESDNYHHSWPCAPMDQKYISHFPEDRLIWSYGSGYGGNALLGKKCFALRIASAIAHDEGWLAEHMLILKITSPEATVQYIAAAFPSACGKTNLAMLVPSLPEWKVETVGDDIAWLRKGKDGRLYAVNPEAGFFGVAPGTSMKTNPNAMKTLTHDVIFTNVALTDQKGVWWEGNGTTSPSHLLDWKGKDWSYLNATPAAHPNSRFTVAARQCPSLAPEWENPEGVPISAILFGGRRPSTVPLVYESYNWSHGVFVASTIGSEITAATISNQIGTVRRDPFAMLPFIGYNVGDYLKHWLSFSQSNDADQLPKIFSVNWFRKDDNGQYLWPGFGDNIRVLEWIFRRVEGKVAAEESPIGYLPRMEDLHLDGLALTEPSFHALHDVDPIAWEQESLSIASYYESLGKRLPQELWDELHQLQKRLIND